MSFLLFSVIPAQAGIQAYLDKNLSYLDSRFRGNDEGATLDSRFRGNDEGGDSRYPFTRSQASAGMTKRVGFLIPDTRTCYLLPQVQAMQAQACAGMTFFHFS